MRQHYSKAIEDRLECIRTGCPTKESSGKRKISRFIFIFDILLIIVIFFYFYNTQKDEPVYTDSVIQDNIQYRFTCTKNDDMYIFSVALSGSSSSSEINFNGYIADLVIYYRNSIIIHEKIGAKKQSLSLEEGKADNYFTQISGTEISAHIHRKDAADGSESDGLYDLLFGEKAQVIAKVTFNNSDRITIDTAIPVER